GGDLLNREVYALSVRPKKAAAWLAEPELEQRADLYQKWLDLPFWQDDRDEPYPRTADPRGSLAFVRVVAADVLRELPEQGATLDSCAGRLRYRMPGWFAAGATGLPSDGLSLNDSLAYVRGVLRALVWLGLADPL